MKALQTCLFCLFIFSCSSSRYAPEKKTYLDTSGNHITHTEFKEKLRNGFSKWGYVENNQNFEKLGPLFERYTISYVPFAENIEKITGKQFASETIFLIEYHFLDDLCSSRYSNNWSKSTIRERKDFLDPQKESIEKGFKNVVFLHFFEEGVELSNQPNSEKEYFFKDSSNFLRKTLFTNPASCGSFALLKPNGQVLIRNGEHRADWMAELLTPEKWGFFFPEKK